jgi:hypothetical protein
MNSESMGRQMPKALVEIKAARALRPMKPRAGGLRDMFPCKPGQISTTSIWPTWSLAGDVRRPDPSPQSAHAGSYKTLRWRIPGWVRRLLALTQIQFDFIAVRLEVGDVAPFPGLLEGIFARCGRSFLGLSGTACGRSDRKGSLHESRGNVGYLRAD